MQRYFCYSNAQIARPSPGSHASSFLSLALLDRLAAWPHYHLWQRHQRQQRQHLPPQYQLLWLWIRPRQVPEQVAIQRMSICQWIMTDDWLIRERLQERTRAQRSWHLSLTTNRSTSRRRTSPPINTAPPMAKPSTQPVTKRKRGRLAKNASQQAKENWGWDFFISVMAYFQYASYGQMLPICKLQDLCPALMRYNVSKSPSDTFRAGMRLKRLRRSIASSESTHTSLKSSELSQLARPTQTFLNIEKTPAEPPVFTLKFWLSLCHLLGTKQSLSTAFHPHTDGQSLTSILCQFQADRSQIFFFCFFFFWLHAWRSSLPRRQASIVCYMILCVSGFLSYISPIRSPTWAAGKRF